jgi:hypothetical protein
MKHAGPEALDALDDFLAKLRTLEGMRERKRGVFYRKGRAFLHFHEDPGGLFAHIRWETGWKRIEVTRAAQRATLLSRIRAAVAGD